MKNFKHSLVAIIAVAMISSLAAAQAADLKNSKAEREQRINANAQQQSITIAQKDITEAVKGTAEIVPEGTEEEEEYDPIEESEIAAKRFYPIGYVLSTGGSVNVRETPSGEAEVAGEVELCSEVEVLESSEGWYKISYDGGNTGYVAKSYITQDKAKAEEAKKSIDNYKIAQVNLEGNAVRVRSGASTDSSILDELNDGRYVYMVEGEDDFIKVIYGPEYEEGYIINTALEFTGEWEEKETIAEKRQEIEEAKAEAARRAEEERKAAERAEQIARRNAELAGNSTWEGATSSSSGSASAASSSSSSGGQAIVDTAMKYLGVPYVWGGTSPRGFDCSGLVQYVCKQNGISVNRVAADQRNNGTYVSRENLQPGDLVFFGRSGGIHHVGIYVGNGNMIHAPQTGDVVKISSINTEYRISQYAGAVRVW